MLKAKLRIIGGLDSNSEISLVLPATVGRSRENEIPLNHPLVSRHHCKIYERDGMLRVRDLGSLNGTYVGRDRIEDQELYPGDLLTIGSFTFRAIYGAYVESMAIVDDEELELQSTVDGEDLESQSGATSVGPNLGFEPPAAEQTVPLTESGVDTTPVSKSRTSTTVRSNHGRRKKKSR